MGAFGWCLEGLGGNEGIEVKLKFHHPKIPPPPPPTVLGKKGFRFQCLRKSAYQDKGQCFVSVGRKKTSYGHKFAFVSV